MCENLGFPFETKDYMFVNDQTQWFDDKGQRKFDVFIVPGGDAYKWFETSSLLYSGPGINASGIQNISRFLDSAGSVIAICHCGTGVLAHATVWIGSTPDDIQAHPGSTWSPVFRKGPGDIIRLFGGAPIFKGTVWGPQDSNLPYPRVRFLSIRLNPEDSIVKNANLPDTVYLWVSGGGSLIPDPGQSMEVIGSFPNGTAAIGVVKYGNGNVYLVAPHPNLNLDNAITGTKNIVSSSYAKLFGVSDEQMTEALSILEKEGDPDGSTPDLTLMRAILQDAAARASAPIK
jgi:hypothetical protein